MIIRGISQRDIAQLEQIHEQFFKNEFTLDEFINSNFIGSFSVVQDDTLICAGGVRTIPELVVVTNKSLSPRIRNEALLKALAAAKHISKDSGHNHLHAFIQGDTWLKQLLNRGFRKTTGTSILTDCE